MAQWTISKTVWITIRGYQFATMYDQGTFDTQEEVTKRLLGIDGVRDCCVSEWKVVNVGKIVKQTMGDKWLKLYVTK